MVGAKVPNERGVFVFYMIYSLPFLPEKVLALAFFDTSGCFGGFLT